MSKSKTNHLKNMNKLLKIKDKKKKTRRMKNNPMNNSSKKNKKLTSLFNKFFIKANNRKSHKFFNRLLKKTYKMTKNILQNLSKIIYLNLQQTKWHQFQTKCCLCFRKWKRWKLRLKKIYRNLQKITKTNKKSMKSLKLMSQSPWKFRRIKTKMATKVKLSNVIKKSKKMKLRKYKKITNCQTRRMKLSITMK